MLGANEEQVGNLSSKRKPSNIPRAVGGGGVRSSRWRKMALQWRVNSQELGSGILHIISTTHRLGRLRRRESYGQQQEKEKGRRHGRGRSRSAGVVLSSGHGCSWFESVLHSDSSVLQYIHTHRTGLVMCFELVVGGRSSWQNLNPGGWIPIDM